MKISTLEKYLNLLINIKESGLSISNYCKENNLKVANIYNIVSKINSDTENRSELASKILDLYCELCNIDEVLFSEDVETDDKAETSYERDQNGHIKYYKYEIFKKNKRPLSGRLSREEMATIYRLYSYYGDSLTRRAISRHFPDLSLVDFKRILKAFNIYKDSSPFPPHYIEEYSEEELREIQLREKENSFLRKAEEDDIKNTQKLLRKIAQENIDLKKKIESLSINVSIPTNIEPYYIPEYCETGKSINLYLADMHIGSYTISDAIYKENSNYGELEIKKRLSNILDRLSKFDCFDTINLVLLGDQLDCCGIPNKTASLTHDMPENMDPKKQADTYFSIMMWFIGSLLDKNREFCSYLNVYTVPTGNHSGSFEYACNKALMAMINAKYPNIQTVMWDQFYGVFKQDSHTFICTHGKADSFMKKGLPLNLDDKSKILVYDWLEENNIHGNNIHFIKGDLHSNNLNSCKRFDYRNVLSLYGSSDYSNMNFQRNNYGMSYDLLIEDNLIRGTFENI